MRLRATALPILRVTVTPKRARSGIAPPEATASPAATGPSVTRPGFTNNTKPGLATRTPWFAATKSALLRITAKDNVPANGASGSALRSPATADPDRFCVRPTVSSGHERGAHAGCCDHQPWRCGHENRGGAREREGLAEMCASWVCSFMFEWTGADRQDHRQTNPPARRAALGNQGLADTQCQRLRQGRTQRNHQGPEIHADLVTKEPDPKKARPSPAGLKSFGRGCLKCICGVHCTQLLCKCKKPDRIALFAIIRLLL